MHVTLGYLRSIASRSPHAHAPHAHVPHAHVPHAHAPVASVHAGALSSAGARGCARHPVHRVGARQQAATC